MNIKEKLEKINEINRFLIEWCEYFSEDKENLIISDERIKEIIDEDEDIETLEYAFPGPDEYVEMDIEAIISIGEEIKSISIINNGLIKTKLRSYYIVSAFNGNDEYFLKEHHNIQKIKKEGIQIGLITESFIVGLAATYLKEYDSDFWGTYYQYLAIEIEYDDQNKVLDTRAEKELLNSYIFEIADSTDIALSLSEIRNPANDYEDFLETEGSNVPLQLRELESCNEGMKFFISAVQIEDPEVKFLNFYKVLEHFSPVAVNMEANELMRKKLDAPKSAFEDGDYIRSIFDLANTMRDRFNDEDLIKASFNTCIDIVGLYKKLPESIQKKIRKATGVPEFSYKVGKDKIIQASNIASKIIYKTRNKVVHAKSNFNLTGDEVGVEEYKELNEFMKEASSQAIRWYGRQPDHLKLEVIK